MSSFGKRFKSIRLSLGLTQDELINDFNKRYGYSFSKATISLYENNKRIPEMNTLKKLAQYFSVSLDYLLCNDIDIVKENTGVYLDNKKEGKVELEEIIGLIKSLGEDNLITYNKIQLSQEQLSLLNNGIDVIFGIIAKVEK